MKNLVTESRLLSRRHKAVKDVVVSLTRGAMKRLETQATVTSRNKKIPTTLINSVTFLTRLAAAPTNSSKMGHAYIHRCAAYNAMIEQSMVGGETSAVTEDIKDTLDKVRQTYYMDGDITSCGMNALTIAIVLEDYIGLGEVHRYSDLWRYEVTMGETQYENPGFLVLENTRVSRSQDSFLCLRIAYWIYLDMDEEHLPHVTRFLVAARDILDKTDDPVGSDADSADYADGADGVDGDIHAVLVAKGEYERLRVVRAFMGIIQYDQCEGEIVKYLDNTLVGGGMRNPNTGVYIDTRSKNYVKHCGLLKGMFVVTKAEESMLNPIKDLRRGEDIYAHMNLLGLFRSDSQLNKIESFANRVYKRLILKN